MNRLSSRQRRCPPTALAACLLALVFLLPGAGAGSARAESIDADGRFGNWAVGGLAIVGGRGLLKLIPLTWISRIAAVVMLILAGVSLAAALS